MLMYCFYKTFSSYLHCEWATEQQLLKDKRIQQKIKRFKLRQAQRAHFLADVRKKALPNLVLFIIILRMELAMQLSGRIFVQHIQNPEFWSQNHKTKYYFFTFPVLIVDCKCYLHVFFSSQNQLGNSWNKSHNKQAQWHMSFILGGRNISLSLWPAWSPQQFQVSQGYLVSVVF